MDLVRSSALRLSDVRAVFRKVGELREVRESGPSWRTQMVDALCHLVGAKAGMSCESEVPLDYPPRIKEDSAISGWTRAERSLWQASSAVSTIETNPTIGATRSIEARSFTVPRRALARDRVWYRSPYAQEFLRPIGVDDHVVSICRLERRSRIDALALYRPWGDRAFSDREIGMIQLFHEEVGWLLDRDLSIPIARLSKLAPRLRETLECLLEGDSEKQIARRLAISSHTVHDYVKEIHRKLGVHSRGELLAQFVSLR
jgi:DNA-binding CsgD family transcriptional regulator